MDTAAVAAPIALLGDTAAIRARYFDLNLLGWEAGSEVSRMVAEAVVFGSGKPTILFPATADVPAFDHVAIAWDGSRVAARAVTDARLFLERAYRVSVITAVDEKPLKDADVGERLAEGLRTRGLNAEAVSVMAGDRPIAPTLQEEAKEKGCGLLVMGGYGHSRLRDFVLGGATEGILADLSMSVLVSH
jgi:nucleotide-binding universal stress UspA family protein